MPVELPQDIETLVGRALRRQVRLPEFSQPVYIREAERNGRYPQGARISPQPPLPLQRRSLLQWRFCSLHFMIRE